MACALLMGLLSWNADASVRLLRPSSCLVDAPPVARRSQTLLSRVCSGMGSPSSEHVASLLREYGQRLALQGGNPYRCRAYVTAAEQVAAVGDSLGLLVARGELTTIP